MNPTLKENLENRRHQSNYPIESVYYECIQKIGDALQKLKAMKCRRCLKVHSRKDHIRLYSEQDIDEVMGRFDTP